MYLKAQAAVAKGGLRRFDVSKLVKPSTCQRVTRPRRRRCTDDLHPPYFFTLFWDVVSYKTHRADLRSTISGGAAPEKRGYSVTVARFCAQSRRSLVLRRTGVPISTTIPSKPFCGRRLTTRWRRWSHLCQIVSYHNPLFFSYYFFLLAVKKTEATADRFCETEAKIKRPLRTMQVSFSYKNSIVVPFLLSTETTSKIAAESFLFPKLLSVLTESVRPEQQYRK